MRRRFGAAGRNGSSDGRAARRRQMRGKLILLPPGTTVGSWTVLCFDGKRGSNGMHKCRCKCGTVRSIATSQLTRGGSKCCGAGECASNWRGGQKNKGSLAWAAGVLKASKRNAEKLGYVPATASEVEVARLFRQANGRCTCCGRSNVTLCLDHCHTQGVVRSFICHTCNRVIGLGGESQRYFAKVAKYLSKHCVQRRLEFASASAGEGHGG